MAEYQLKRIVELLARRGLNINPVNKGKLIVDTSHRKQSNLAISSLLRKN
jgi:hypothetical protein